MKKILLLFAVASLFAACGDDAADRTGQIVLAPSQTTLLEVDYYATSVPVGFSADLNWIVDYVSGGGAEGWYAVDPASGMAGEATIAVQVGENTTGAQREGMFRIVCASAAVEFKVRQFAEDTPDNPYVTIPDEKFRAYLLEHFDTDGDLKLSKQEAAAIRELVCEQMEIASLRGIEHMPNLEVLDISYNSIPGELDLSGFSKLTRLECDHNPLTALSVNGCASLEWLKANDCYYLDEYRQTIYTLEAIDLAGCTALDNLNVEDNRLKALDLGDCIALRDLRSAYNDFTTIDFSACTKLVNCTCRNNPLNGLVLDLSMCPDLKYLACWEAGLAGVNVSGCTKLEQLLAYYNDLGSIDVSSCTSLVELILHGTKISSIDLGNNVKLSKLDVSFNEIGRLDLSACTELTELRLGGNQVTELDVSMCPRLKRLEAPQNKLTSLNVTGCTQLDALSLYQNELTRLDLGTCTALTQLTVSENALTELDVNSAPNLFILNCPDNKLVDLKIDNCGELVSLDAERNQLSRLDLRPNKLIREVYLGGNKLTEIGISDLPDLTILQLQQNGLTQIDLKGCTAIDELHVFTNKIEFLSVIPCKAIRYLDCRQTLIRSLDLSNNPQMNFLFATLNPNLRTVFIADGANYSSLEVDEGVEVYYRQPESYDDVGGNGWGDAQINPWENQ